MQELEVPAPGAGVDRIRIGVDAPDRALTGCRHERLHRLHALQSYRLIRAAALSAKRPFLLPSLIVTDIPTSDACLFRRASRRVKAMRRGGLERLAGAGITSVTWRTIGLIALA